MNERKLMGYELVKLTLQGVVLVAMSGIVDGLSQMIFRKPLGRRKDKMVKVANYVVSEIIAGGISAVVDKEIDGIREEMEP